MSKLIIAILLIFTSQVLAKTDQDTFILTTVNDKNLTLKGTAEGLYIQEYKGKILFIDFWSQKCGPCLMSIPHLVHLQEKYKDDLRIVSIEALRSPRQELKEYANNPAKHINMKYVKSFMSRKVKDQAGKDALNPSIQELQKFIKSNKKLNYDIVSSLDSNGFIDYVMQRTKWYGAIPFLLVLDQKGKVSDMILGLSSKEKIQRLITDLIKKHK